MGLKEGYYEYYIAIVLNQAGGIIDKACQQKTI